MTTVKTERSDGPMAHGRMMQDWKISYGDLVFSRSQPRESTPGQPPPSTAPSYPGRDASLNHRRNASSARLAAMRADPAASACGLLRGFVTQHGHSRLRRRLRRPHCIGKTPMSLGSNKQRKILKKAFLITVLTVGALSAPFWVPMMKNEMRGRELANRPGAANLPRNAEIIERSHRVFVGGNGNGCDYQGLVIVSYWGDVSELQQAFVATLTNYEKRFNDPKILSDETKSRAIWSAKIRGRSTELSIRPNKDHAGLYLVDLTVYARKESMDFRCT